MFPCIQCIQCGKEVRPRQHAVDCDWCGQWQHRRHTPGVRVSLDTSGVAACTVARPRPDVHGAESGILIREDGPRIAFSAGRAHWKDPGDVRGASLYTRDDTPRHLHRPAVSQKLGFPRVNLVGLREDD